MARRVELWDDDLVMRTLAARVAVLAFGDELVDLSLPDILRLPDNVDPLWLSQGGREMAAAHLLPRAEAALRQEMEQVTDAGKRARRGQRTSSSGAL